MIKTIKTLACLSFLVLCLLSFFSCSSGNKKGGDGEHAKLENREGKGRLTDHPVDSTTEVLLPDANGTNRSIEQMRGDYVLMDVILDVPQQKDKHIASLLSEYKEYHSRGLQIYQVCMSKDAASWRKAAKHYPWTAVYDDQTLQSALLEKYYVVTIPSMCLFSRDGKSLGNVNDANLHDRLKELFAK